MMQAAMYRQKQAGSRIHTAGFLPFCMTNSLSFEPNSGRWTCISGGLHTALHAQQIQNGTGHPKRFRQVVEKAKRNKQPRQRRGTARKFKVPRMLAAPREHVGSLDYKVV